MSWDEILGQELAVRTFQTHLAEGRVPNAYLLVGPDGVGKRRLCLEMAKALNCTGSTRPCDRCASCLQIARGMHPDLHLLSPGGAIDQIKIDEVRHLLGRLALRPFSASVQVAIIDGAERVRDDAANSLLKSLEEPPAHARFLLTTSQRSQCLPTIVSRCQIVRCRPLPTTTLIKLLAGREGVASEQAEAVARCARGSASAAWELLERWEGYRQTVTRLAHDAPADWMRQPLPDTRAGVQQLLDGMMDWLRDVAVTSADGARWALHAQEADALRRQSARLDRDRCFATAVELIHLRESLEQFVSPNLVAALAREQWLSLIDG